MNPFCFFSKSSFKETVGDLWMSEGIESNQSVDLLLTDPPHNTISAPYRPKFEYDSLSTEQMAYVVELVETVISLGGHGPLFCSSLQFRQWFTALYWWTEEVPMDNLGGVNQVIYTHKSFTT